MGAGNVLTGRCVDPETGAGVFLFYDRPEEHRFGPAPELDGAVPLEEADALMLFKDVPAIDAMIASLQELRGAMIPKPKQEPKCPECEDDLCGGTGIFDGRKCNGIPF